MDKIHKFSPIIKQKFGLVFGGHYKHKQEIQRWLKSDPNITIAWVKIKLEEFKKNSNRNKRKKSK